MKIDISRRDLLIGGTSAFLAAAVTTITGLGIHEFRNPPPPARPLTATVSDRWILSDSDYKVLAAADLPVESDVLALYDQVDYPGSDFKELKVESLGECVEACEGDKRCKSFTYAKSTHLLPKKRQMCWLKDANDHIGNDKAFGYVSGKK